MKYLISFILFIGITFSHTSCGSNDSTAEQTMDEFTPEDPGSGAFEDETLITDTTTNYGDEPTTEDYYQSPLGNEKEEANANSESEITYQTPTDAPQPVVQQTKTQEEYFVITGNYLLKENAEQMSKKLKGYGYAKIEIVNFDMSQYYTVIVGRYSNRAEADKVSTNLRAKSIDAYIKKKQK